MAVGRARAKGGRSTRWIGRLVGSATLAAVITIPPAAFRTYPAPWSPGLGGGGVLTPDAGDSYTYSSSTGAMDAAALPSNSSGNLRAVFWPTHALAKHNEQTCATWASESTWRAQEGAALRVNVEHDGAVRAVTVTKNIWYGATWIFNVHVWNSRWALPFRQIGVFSLESAFREPSGLGAALPWRICARAQDANFEFKVWRLSSPEPQWGDPIQGGSMKLPRSVPATGYAGWYIGHLPAGASASFTGLGTWAMPDSGDQPGVLPPAIVAGPANHRAAARSSVVIRRPTSPR